MNHKKQSKQSSTQSKQRLEKQRFEKIKQKNRSRMILPKNRNVNKNRNANRIILVEINLHREQAGLFLKVIDTETRAFSSMQKARRWLIKNGFCYGYSYDDDRDYDCDQDYAHDQDHDHAGEERTWLDEKKTWHHKNDEIWKFVEVKISEHILDNNRDSKFKNFEKELSPWARAAKIDGFREGFMEVMKERGIDDETSEKLYQEAFERNFG